MIGLTDHPCKSPFALFKNRLSIENKLNKKIALYTSTTPHGL